MNLPSVPRPLPGLESRTDLLRNSVMLRAGDGTYEIVWVEAGGSAQQHGGEKTVEIHLQLW